MGEHYVLNADHSVREVPLEEWATAFEDRENRRVGRTEFPDGTVISTVFLGLDHSFGDGPPLLFETMIFGGAMDQEMWRYSTWDEAAAGHEHAERLAAATKARGEQ